MKFSVIYFLLTLFMVLSPTQPVISQEFKIPINVSDGLNSAEIVIGVHAGGLVEYNANLDTYAPPSPPQGIFDTRIIINGEAYIQKILNNSLDEKIFPLKTQLSAGQSSMVLEWDNEYFDEMGNFLIRVDDVEYDMAAMSEFVIPNDFFGQPKTIGIFITPHKFDPPEAPALFSPEHQEIIHQDNVLLSWSRSDASGARYDIDVAADNEFNDVIHFEEAIADTKYVFHHDDLLNNIWWRVRVRYPGGPGEYSPSRTFQFNVTQVTDGNEAIPDRFVLHQNYPNPFNPATNIRYEIPEESNVKIKIYNALGQKIDILVDEHHTAGLYEVVFDASHLPGGMYIYRLTTGTFTQSRKLVLIK